MARLAEKAEASTLTSLENTIEAKIGDLGTIQAPSTLMSQVAGAIQSLNEHKLKIGDLDTIAPATLIQKLADAETAIAGLSSPGSGPSSTTTWMQSPDYDLGSHPNDDTVVRWAHMQSDPIQVHMHVRVRDASENERGEHVYPYSDIRVQPRYVATNDMPLVRYLKLNFQEHPVAITFVHVKIRTLNPASPNPNPFWINMDNRRVQHDNLMDLDNLTYPYYPDNVGQYTKEIGAGPKMIEFDLGQYVRVEHVRIYGDDELASIDGNNVNFGMNVQLLTADRPMTENVFDKYIFFEGHPSIAWNSGFSYLDNIRDWRGKTFSSSNDIEVIFDNASMTKLMKVDRTDTNLLRPGDTTRFFFLRAQFTSDSIRTSGANDQKTPDGWETFVFDFT
jgi:hypothetical protein